MKCLWKLCFSINIKKKIIFFAGEGGGGGGQIP